MRIGCLQFAPQVGDVDNNLNRADAILNKVDPTNLDILVLPELAFTGYNFKSLHDIAPFLEPTGAGITSVWARTTALKYNCKVAVGYPETADVSHKWPTSPEYYNSAIIVNEDGDTWGHYRKSHLYYVDETWALEGPGFFKGTIPGLGRVAMGICMDLNPYRFEAPWNAYELAFHILDVSANVVIMSMAWSTREDAERFSCQPKEPDMETLTYWVTRLEPLIRSESEDEIIVIFANRSGIEDDAVYAGTSAVLGIQDGEVTVYGLLGRGDKDLLVVDTETPGFAKLVYRPEDQAQKTKDVCPDESKTSPGHPEFSDGESLSSNSPIGPRSDLWRSDASDSQSHDATATRRANRRSFGGHIFVEADSIHSSRSRLAPPTDDESPVSPRYFWNQPQPDVLTASQYPNLGIHNSYQEWHSSLGHNHPHEHEHQEVPEDRDLNPTSQAEELEFSSLLAGLRQSNATQDSSIDRPFSTKNHNSVPGRLESQATDSWDRNFAREQRSASPKDKKHSRRSSPSAPQDTPRHVTARDDAEDRHQAKRDRTSIPDLEKLGADLFVFEGERKKRSNRDSLVCHVDDDDYIVLRTARKDNASRSHRSADNKEASSLESRNKTPSSGARERERERERHGTHRSSSTQLFPSQGKAAESGKRNGSQPSFNGTQTRGSTPKRTSDGRSDNKIAPPKMNEYHPREVYGRDDETNLKAHRPNLASAPPRRPRQSERSPDDYYRRQHSPGAVVEQMVTVPARAINKSSRGKHKGASKGSVSSVDVPILFSPGGLDTDSSLYASTGVFSTTPGTGLTEPEKMSAKMPPTPKAMALPPEYNVSHGHQSVPPPRREKASETNVNVLNRIDVSAERPRSVV